MSKIRFTISGQIALILVSILIGSCKREYIPTQQVVATNDYVGEWNGTTAVTRALTGTDIVETSAPLTEIMSLRQENGKDTVNFKDPTTGLNIAGRNGTWSITEVTNTEDPSLNGARLLRLRVITAANRITYTNFTIKALQAKTLVLNNGANKTLTYTK